MTADVSGIPARLPSARPSPIPRLLLVAFLLVSWLLSPSGESEINPPPPGEGTTVFHSGDWTVETGDRVWRGNGTLVLSGNLTVQAGGVLAIHNFTLLMNSSYDLQFGLTVEPGGTLRLDDAVLDTYNTALTFPFRFEVYGTIKAVNTTIILGNSLFANGGDVSLQGGRLSRPTGTCLDLDSSNLTARGITFECGMGIYADRSSLLVEGCIFDDPIWGMNAVNSASIIVNNTIWSRSGIQLNGGNAVVTDNRIQSRVMPSGTGIYLGVMSNESVVARNVVTGGDYGFLLQLTSPVMWENTAVNSTRVGIHLVDSSPTIWNSTFVGSVTADINLFDDSFASGGSNPILVNVTFDPDQLRFEPLFASQNLSVDVRWFLTGRTVGPDGSPLAGSSVAVQDAFGTPSPPQSTDASGSTPRLVVRDYVARDLDLSERAESPGERNYSTPHNVTASWGPNSATQTVTMNQSRTVTFVLGELANVTATRTPLRGNVSLDGVPKPAPAIATWLVGSTHTVESPLLDDDGAGTRYGFLNWSDGGPRSHSVIVPAGNATLIAAYRTQHRLRLGLPGTDADHPVLVTHLGNGTVHTASVWGQWEGWVDAGTEAFVSDCTGGEPRRCTSDPHEWVVAEPLDVTVSYGASNVASVSGNLKPMVAAFFALAIAVAGLRIARRATKRDGKRSAWKVWALHVAPWLLLEVATGLLSLFTGVLSIPPLLGAGTVVDLAILGASLAAPLITTRRDRAKGREEEPIPPPPPPP